jgi:hypothetical protein
MVGAFQIVDAGAGKPILARTFGWQMVGLTLRATRYEVRQFSFRWWRKWSVVVRFAGGSSRWLSHHYAREATQEAVDTTNLADSGPDRKRGGAAPRRQTDPGSIGQNAARDRVTDGAGVSSLQAFAMHEVCGIQMPKDGIDTCIDTVDSTKTQSGGLNVSGRL